jgi:hypothetical protein
MTTVVHPPKMSIDVKQRLVLVEQKHGTLVGEPQKVLLPFAAIKQLAAKLLMVEAQNEAATGDPRTPPATADAAPPPPGIVQ